MGSALDFALKLLGLVPYALEAGGDVLNIVTTGSETLKAMVAQNRGPTAAEWSNLDQQISGLMAQLKP